VQIESNWFESAYAPGGITWTQAALDAQAQGGYLAIIPDATTNAGVYNLISDPKFWSSSAQVVGAGYLGPWLGGYASAVGNWNWVTSVNADGSPATYSGTPLPLPGASGYSAWWGGQPDYYGGSGLGQVVPQALQYFAGGYSGYDTWGDCTLDASSGSSGLSNPQGFVVEFNSEPNAIPEPCTLTIWGSVLLGLGGLAWLRRRRAKA
jgi:hypothetical protein